MRKQNCQPDDVIGAHSGEKYSNNSTRNEKKNESIVVMHYSYNYLFLIVFLHCVVLMIDYYLLLLCDVVIFL